MIHKGIENADIVVHKPGTALTKATNHRLEVARKMRQKRDEMMERRKIEAMSARRQRARRRISFFSKEERSYKSDTGDETDLDQADNKYPLSF